MPRTAGREALIGLERFDEAVEAYEKGLQRRPPPEPRHRESARKGVLRMAGDRAIPESTLNRLKDILR